MNFSSFLWLFIVAIFATEFESCVAVKYCSSYCKCGLFENKNFADCSGKRLINPYVDLSSSVEVLDLSYNDIAIIENRCFENYHFLVNLTITHNDIHTIYLDAFVKLRRLRVINLAYNRLTYLDEHLFETNRKLHSLNLEGNKFMSLPSRPFLRSTSLRVLSLRNTGIDSIDMQVLTALPQLNQLDLSQNLMITLDAASFNALNHLTVLALDANPWNCDDILVRSLSIMRLHGLNVSIAECDAAYSQWQQKLPLHVDSSKQAKVPKLERLTLPSAETDNNATNKTEDPIETVNWRNVSAENENSDDDGANAMLNSDDGADDDDGMTNYFDDDRASASRMSLLHVNVDEELCTDTHENLCRRYRHCLAQVSHILIKRIQETDEKGVVYTKIDLEFAFLLGIAVGITSVVSIISCALCVKNCFRMKKRNSRDLEGIYGTVPSVTPSQQINTTEHPIHSRNVDPCPQPPTRRPRRTHRPPPRPMEHAVVRRAHDSDSFIGRLLGRPARREYYRVSTATLIRCISRTNLFNNLQNNSNSSGRSNPSSPTTEAAPLNAARPETPPPKYGDIVDEK